MAAPVEVRRVSWIPPPARQPVAGDVALAKDPKLKIKFIQRGEWLVM